MAAFFECEPFPLTLFDGGGGGLRSPTLRFFLSRRQSAKAYNATKAPGASELKLSDFVDIFIAHIWANKILPC